MEMINEKEMDLVNGGIMTGNSTKMNCDINREAHQREFFEQEKQKMQGLADIRLRAADNALKAAMRVRHAEMEIKEAQRTIAAMI